MPTNQPVEQEEQKRPADVGDAVATKAETEAQGEATTGKDSFYEDMARKGRTLMKAREDGLRTGTHEEFGTPTIEGDKGTLIKGGEPSKATLTQEQLRERMKEQTGGNGKQPPDAPATVDQAFRVNTGQQGPAEQTGTVIDYKPGQTGDKSFKLGMDYEDRPDTRTPTEKLQDFVQAAAKRATDPEGWKAWMQGEINKFDGIGAGLNEAKEETKAAVAAGWKALTDGTVVEFLSQPNAINAPVFKTVANAFDAMSKDPEATNKAFEALGHVVMKASEGYSNLPDYEKGKVIGKVMFGMVNPEGSTEGAEAALKVADQVATHVDKAVWDTIGQTVTSIKDMAPDVAEQTKQMLYDYIKSKGLTGTELEAAGIPKGYFDGMQEAPGPGKGDNLLAMSKAEDLEGEAQMRGKAGAGGDWPVINERPSPDVVRQTKQMSCVSACGEMLSKGALKQSELIEKLGTPAPTQYLAKHLGPEWVAKVKGDEALDDLLQRGSWATELREPMGMRYARLEPGHTVVVDGLDDAGNIKIRDPEHGTRYEMTRKDFLEVWTGISVFKS